MACSREMLLQVMFATGGMISFCLIFVLAAVALAVRIDAAIVQTDTAVALIQGAAAAAYSAHPAAAYLVVSASAQPRAGVG